MFGFVVADAGALSEEEKERYRAVYCGLCLALRDRYGQLSRACLTYDLTFFVLLCNSLHEPAELSMGKEHLYVWEMTPGILHENDAAERLLAGAYERARARIPEQCAEIERAMAAIRAIEGAGRNNAASLSSAAKPACIPPLSTDATDAAPVFDPDAAAREFGRMLGRLFAHNQGFWTEAMEELGRGLGRFIYLMDAAVDFANDARTGSYNPFVTLGSDADAMRATLALAAADAAAPYERLPLVQDAHLMDAILYSGVWAQFNKAYPPQDALAQNEGSTQSEPPRN